MKEYVYHDGETITKVYRAITECGLSPAKAGDIVNALQDVGILFRELKLDVVPPTDIVVEEGDIVAEKALESIECFDFVTYNDEGERLLLGRGFLARSLAEPGKTLITGQLDFKEHDDIHTTRASDR